MRCVSQTQSCIDMAPVADVPLHNWGLAKYTQLKADSVCTTYDKPDSNGGVGILSNTVAAKEACQAAQTQMSS